MLLKTDKAHLEMDAWNTTPFTLGQKAYFQGRLLLVSGRVYIYICVYIYNMHSIL